MSVVRLAEERGRANFGWLDSRHTFSFGRYVDPNHMGFRALRVINDDRVAPGGGFGQHPHDNMEILSYVVQGALAHRDSLGTGSVIRPGDVQLMSAGTGVTHSEFNASESEPVRFLQIWLPPERRGLTPSYQQEHFAAESRQDTLRLLVSPDGQEGSLRIHRDVSIYGALLAQGASVSHRFKPGRHLWAQIVRGEVRFNNERTLKEGDGLALSEGGELKLQGVAEQSELLVFDLD